MRAHRTKKKDVYRTTGEDGKRGTTRDLSLHPQGSALLWVTMYCVTNVKNETWLLTCVQTGNVDHYLTVLMVRVPYSSG